MRTEKDWMNLRLQETLGINLNDAWKAEYIRLGGIYASWGALMVIFLYPLSVIPELSIEKDNVNLWYFFRFAPSIVVAIAYLIFKKYKYSHEVLFEIIALMLFMSGAYRAACGDWTNYLISNIALYITSAVLTILRPFFFVINYILILALNVAFYMYFCDMGFADFWVSKGVNILIVIGIACFSMAVFRYYILKTNFQHRMALEEAHMELQSRNQKLVKAQRELRVKNNQIAEQNEELTMQKEEILTQRDALEYQKDKIEEQNRDIIGSINYARRIQYALLPEEQKLANSFKDFFVFYRPRDIVSGDFYWMQETNNKIFFAVVDCTGHGVPGALMSMLASSSLNNIVLRKKEHMPERILEVLDEDISAILKGDITGTYDGMDISLVVYEKKNRNLHFSGAHHPLLMFKNGKVDYIKGESIGIGGRYFGPKEYKCHTVQIEVDTTVYLYSDGFQDQFGGTRGKKFMAPKFRSLLAEMHEEPMDIQYRILSDTMEQWMNDSGQEQVDDVLVVGLKLNV